MRFIVLVVALMFATITARGQAAPLTQDPAPDCTLYSLEGVRIGMSLDEARAVLPGSEFNKRDAGVPKGEKGLHWTIRRPASKKADRSRIWMALQLDETGHVVFMENQYVDTPGLGQLMAGGPVLVERLPPEDLIAAFTARFGDPTSEQTVDQKAQAQGIKAATIFGTRTVEWENDACDRIVTVETGREMGTDGPLPILTGAVAKRSWLKKRVDTTVSSKVKF